MTEPLLALIHDPARRTTAPEAARRVRAALGGSRDARVHQAGALTVGWIGPVAAREEATADRTDSAFLAVDGEVGLAPGDPPHAWLAALRTARGAFAVVAWHGARGMIARDHLGARPMFVATDGAMLHAASEVRLLLELLGRRPEPDVDALALFLARRPAPDGRTLFAGIRALEPAHALLFDAERTRLARFWRPRPRSGLGDVDADEAARLLQGEIRAAVRRSGGDRPDAGVLLSGGLDSSTVLACAAADAREAGADVPPAFSGVFPGMPELDEREFAVAVAQRADAAWTPVPARPGPLVPDALAYAETWDVPLEFPGAMFFRPVLEEAARQGVTVMLDGEGGDELFGCEPLLIADRVLRADLAGAVRLAHALPGAHGRVDIRMARAVLRRWVLPGLLAPRYVAVLRRRRRRAQAPDWLRPHARAAAIAAEAVDRPWWTGGRPRWRARLAWVLSDSRAEMAVHDHLRRTTRPTGLVDAHPFLDVDLIELVLGLPAEFAFDAELDRPLLRRAMTGLIPDAARLRTGKVYFDRMLLDALTGADRPAVDAVLGADRLELASVVEPAKVRALWRSGPQAHGPGKWLWAADVWRVFAAETWLRREAGAE